MQTDRESKEPRKERKSSIGLRTRARHICFRDAIEGLSERIGVLCKAFSGSLLYSPQIRGHVCSLGISQGNLRQHDGMDMMYLDPLLMGSDDGWDLTSLFYRPRTYDMFKEQGHSTGGG